MSQRVSFVRVSLKVANYDHAYKEGASYASEEFIGVGFSMAVIVRFGERFERFYQRGQSAKTLVVTFPGV